jgi:hypothetical protein
MNNELIIGTASWIFVFILIIRLYSPFNTFITNIKLILNPNTEGERRRDEMQKMVFALILATISASVMITYTPEIMGRLNIRDNDRPKISDNHMDAMNCGNIDSSLVKLLRNNNSKEGEKIVKRLLKYCFDEESEIYPVDENDVTVFEPLSAEDFLMDLYSTKYLVKYKLFNIIINPKNGKIKSLEFYKENVRKAIGKI